MNTHRIRRLAALAGVAGVAAAFAAPATASAADLRSIAIVTAWTGVLDVSGGSTAPGAKVIQYPVTGGSNQRWDVLGDRDASRIVNVKSGLCLTTSGVAGAQLYVTYCNAANPRQTWEFRAPHFAFNSNGSTVAGIIYNAATKLYVDVQGASSLAGTPIIGWYYTGGRQQGFSHWFWN